MIPRSTRRSEQTKLWPPAVPVSYTGDPFIITCKGLPLWARPEPHFMDMGELEKAPEVRFVVPNDFSEFFEWNPHYALKWVKKRLNRFEVDGQVEEWAQKLLCHLLTLPINSKYRKTGKNDIVQTFDPMKHYGANEARFRNYINRCLDNKFKSLHSKGMKDALGRPGNLSFDGQPKGENPRLGDELWHELSSELRASTEASGKQLADAALVQEFAKFVERRDPNVLSVIHAICATATQGEAADWLGIMAYEFSRRLRRLRRLWKCYQSGEPVPAQRKPYKTRAATAKRLSISRRAV